MTKSKLQSNSLQLHLLPTFLFDFDMSGTIDMKPRPSLRLTTLYHRLMHSDVTHFVNLRRGIMEPNGMGLSPLYIAASFDERPIRSKISRQFALIECATQNERHHVDFDVCRRWEDQIQLPAGIFTERCEGRKHYQEILPFDKVLLMFSFHSFVCLL